MPLDSCVDADLSLRPRTRKTYGAALRHYQRAIAGADPLDNATAAAYLHALTDAGLRPRTVRSRYCAIAYAYRARGLPAPDVRLPPLDPARKPVCSDEDLSRAIAACERLPSERRGVMARAILLLLTSTSMRRSDLIGLRVPDVDAEERAIAARRMKGGKRMRHFPDDAAWSAVEAWIAARGACRHDFLFDFDRARHMGDQTLRTLLREVKRVAGLPASCPLLPHAARRGTVTRLIRRGIPLAMIQRFCQHARPQTTIDYACLAEEDVREVAAAAALVRPRIALAWSSSTLPRR